MKVSKHIIIIFLLLIAISVSYFAPRAKYVGTNFISAMEVPLAFAEWQGTDVSKALNINTADTNFNFINDAIAYNYVNRNGKNLLFIILDAGNFHHPKVCFTGAGFDITELPDTEFQLVNRSLKTHTLFTTRDNESFLSFYWIVIDKNVAHEWLEQKFKQLYYSMFNKKKIGLMIRMDIPAKKEDISNASAMAKQFTYNLSQALKRDEAEYILGGK